MTALSMFVLCPVTCCLLIRVTIPFKLMLRLFDAIDECTSDAVATGGGFVGSTVVEMAVKVGWLAVAPEKTLIPGCKPSTVGCGGSNSIYSEDPDCPVMCHGE